MNEFGRVGDAVRAARLGRGWPQARLAKQAGVPQSHIAKVEAGSDVRASTLLRVLDALGYDLSFAPRERPPANSALMRAQEYGVDLASLYRSSRMSPADRLSVAVDSANNLARLLRVHPPETTRGT